MPLLERQYCLVVIWQSILNADPVHFRHYNTKYPLTQYPFSCYRVNVVIAFGNIQDSNRLTQCFHKADVIVRKAFIVCDGMALRGFLGVLEVEGPNLVFVQVYGQREIDLKDAQFVFLRGGLIRPKLLDGPKGKLPQ